jgi:hypothetical protein
MHVEEAMKKTTWRLKNDVKLCRGGFYEDWGSELRCVEKEFIWFVGII